VRCVWCGSSPVRAWQCTVYRWMRYVFGGRVCSRSSQKWFFLQLCGSHLFGYHSKFLYIYGTFLKCSTCDLSLYYGGMSCCLIYSVMYFVYLVDILHNGTFGYHVLDKLLLLLPYLFYLTYQKNSTCLINCHRHYQSLKTWHIYVQHSQALPNRFSTVNIWPIAYFRSINPAWHPPIIWSE
jgi:hypothetical protein